MQRVLVFIYGVVAYALFFATFLYAIGFVGNLFVPKAIDSAPQVPFIQALLVNLGLLGLFAVQHSLMARPFFKRWLTRFIPQAAERSTFVVASSLALIALFAFWQPMGGLIWSIENPQAQILLCIAHWKVNQQPGRQQDRGADQEQVDRAVPVPERDQHRR